MINMEKETCLCMSMFYSISWHNCIHQLHFVVKHTSVYDGAGEIYAALTDGFSPRCCIGWSLDFI